MSETDTEVVGKVGPVSPTPTSVVDVLTARVRTLTAEDIKAIVAVGRKSYEDRNVAKNAALKALAAIMPNWDDRVRAVVNITLTRHAEVSGAHSDPHELAALWALVEAATIGVLAKPALTKEQYSALVSPVSSILPALGDTEGSGAIPQEEIIQRMAEYTKEAQTGRKAKEKAAKVTKAVAQAKANPPKIAKEKAAKAPRAPRTTTTARTPKVIELGKAEAIVKKARAFAEKHADHFDQFTSTKMGYLGGAFNYTLDALIKPVLIEIDGEDALRAVRGEDKVKVGYLVMAGMAATAEGQTRLKKMQRAWAFWEPLATEATGTPDAASSEVAKAIADEAIFEAGFGDVAEPSERITDEAKIGEPVEA